MKQNSLGLERRAELFVHHLDNQKHHRELGSAVSNGHMQKPQGKKNEVEERGALARKGEDLLGKGGVMGKRLETHGHVQVRMSLGLQHGSCPSSFPGKCCKSL